MTFMECCCEQDIGETMIITFFFIHGTYTYIARIFKLHPSFTCFSLVCLLVCILLLKIAQCKNIIEKKLVVLQLFFIIFAIRIFQSKVLLCAWVKILDDIVAMKILYIIFKNDFLLLFFLSPEWMFVYFVTAHNYILSLHPLVIRSPFKALPKSHREIYICYRNFRLRN